MELKRKAEMRRKEGEKDVSRQMGKQKERKKESTRIKTRVKADIKEQSDKTRQLQHWLAHLMTRPQLWALSLLKPVREFFSFIVATWLGSTAGLQHVSWWCVVLCGLREGDVCMAGGSGGPAETL